MPGEVPQVPQVPTVPQVPQAGGIQQKPARKTASQIRQETLDKIAEARKPLFKTAYHKSIKKGSVATFGYSFFKHDPYPLIICSSIYHDGKIAGINLHYLTFNYIRNLIKQYCGKMFSYPLIRGNNFIKNSFRTYKKNGVKGIRVFDCEFLKTILGTVRSFNPNEIEKIRQEVQRQLMTRVQKSADELTQEYLDILNPSAARQGKIADVHPRTIADRRTIPHDIQGI